MEFYQLTKSSIIQGKQCEKALWLNKHKPFLKDPLTKTQKAVFNRGNRVGILAQQIFPNGKNIRSIKGFSMEKAAKATQEAIENGIETIYEATFVFNDVLVMADILHKVRNEWFVYEIKSSLKISSTYIYDAAIQYYALKGNGLNIRDFFITNLNKDYLFNGEIKAEELFKHTSVLSHIIALQPDVKERVGRLNEVVTQEEMPEIAVGNHCFSPYKCDFVGFCWKTIPKDDVKINPTPNINKKVVTEFFSQISYPLALFDVEAFMPAVPLFKNTHPYQQLPFAFVLYVLKKEKTEPEIIRFIAEPQINPEDEFYNTLKKTLKDIKTVLVYDALLESHILNKTFGEFDKKTNVLDFSTIFKQKHIYFDGLEEKSSLKIIADVIDKESKYAEMEINNGRIAQIEYEQLQSSNDMFHIPQQLNALLNYCEEDVKALFRIFQFTRNLV